VIRIAPKDELSCVASLGHVVRHPDGNHTGQTRHKPHLIVITSPLARGEHLTAPAARKLRTTQGCTAMDELLL
jgi:hypothetical protein